MTVEIKEKLDMLNDDPMLGNAILESKSLEELLKLLSDHGIELTEEEINEMVKEESADELFESDLEEVAGGGKIKQVFKDIKAGYKDNTNYKFPKSPFTTAYALGYQIGYAFRR